MLNNFIRITPDALLQALTQWGQEARDGNWSTAGYKTQEESDKAAADYLWDKLEVLALPGSGG